MLRFRSHAIGGFSIIEVLIVVVIISVLAAVAMPIYHNSVVRTIVAECDVAMGSIKNFLIAYRGEHGQYPIQLFDAYVIGKSWNDIRPGELEGQNFNDSSYSYYCWDGINYFLIAQKGAPNPLYRTLDQSGNLETWPIID